MAGELISHEPDYAVPPGETLVEALEEAGLTQVELACRAELSAKHVNRLAKGHVALTPAVAVKLERVLGIPSQFWIAREANYQARLARLAERQATAEELTWLDCLPWRELRKRDCLPQSDDKATLVAAAKRFFGVATAAAWSDVWSQPAVSFRRSSAYEVDQGALASWVRITETHALEAKCAAYDESKFRKTLSEIRSATAHPPEDIGDWLQHACASAGVAVVFEPEIKGARVSGAAYWLAGKPVVALSLRYRSDDQFWFSLFHEAGHILLHPRSERFIDSGKAGHAAPGTAAEAREAERENEANRFAATALIPEQHEERLWNLRALAEIEAFAEELGIAPGIVVGRLQFEGKLPYQVGNGLKRRITFA